MNELTNTLTYLVKQLDLPPTKIELITASPLQAEIVESITQTLGHGWIISQTINPEVTDGVQIKIGNKIFDSSVQKQLEKLSSSIAEDDSDNFLHKMRKEIAGFSAHAETEEWGTVLSVKDGVATISGLPECTYFEILELENGVQALALSLHSDTIGAVLLGEIESVREGMRALRTKTLASVAVGEELLGRVLNAVGEPIDGLPLISLKAHNPIEKIAPGVLTRTPVDRPLQTGIKAIDALIPIGRGQRELILGDKQTGKTAIALDTIINQKKTGVISIYVAIGQKASKVVRITEKLKEAGVMENTVVVAANASEAAGMQFLAPYTGVAIAEFFASQGKDVLIVYDDLSKHAVAYRELSLLLKRPPGREAYPGDVFYIHSRLLERACNLNEQNGGGSITALPIVETLAGDISAYIPTNVISITDGQIFLESDLFYKGQRPAVNVGLSVSRVGSAAQMKPMKKVAGSMKLALAQYREVETFAQFASDLDEATKAQLNRGKRIVEILKQKNNFPVATALQVLSIYAVNNGFLDEITVDKIQEAEANLHKYAMQSYSSMLSQLEEGSWNEEIESSLSNCCKEYITTFVHGS